MGETQVLIRTSERSTYRRCRQKWHWKYVLRLSSTKRKGALEFGSLIHESLEPYYKPGRKRGPHPAKTFAKLYKALDQGEFDQWDDEGNRIPAYDLGIAMLEGYVEHWGKDDHLEILAPEQVFRIDVYDEKGKYVCTFVGKIDAVALNLNTNRFLLLEHKSAKRTEDVAQVSGYGEQGVAYIFAATLLLRSLGLIAEDEWIDGVLYNWLRKGVPDERPVNAEGLYLNKPRKDALQAACLSAGVPQNGTIDTLTDRLLGAGLTQHDIALLGEPSQKQPPPLFERQEMIVRGPRGVMNFEKRLRDEAKEMSRARKGKVPITKSPTKDCRWDCEFFSMCELHEAGADWESDRDLEFTTWEPYSDHELDKENQ